VSCERCDAAQTSKLTNAASGNEVERIPQETVCRSNGYTTSTKNWRTIMVTAQYDDRERPTVSSMLPPRSTQRAKKHKSRVLRLVDHHGPEESPEFLHRRRYAAAKRPTVSARPKTNWSRSMPRRCDSSPRFPKVIDRGEQEGLII
jgi:hypothetical protein